MARMALRYCGVSEKMVVGGAKYCRWPESLLRYCIRDHHPLMAPAHFVGGIQWAIGQITGQFQLDFERVDRPKDAHILFTVANLGGVGGVLADAMLVPCGLKKGHRFQSVVRFDSLDKFTADKRLRAAMVFDVGEVSLHETTHSLGMPHIDTPRGRPALMNPRYNASISGYQPADVEAMVKLGYPIRIVNEGPPPKLPPGKRAALLDLKFAKVYAPAVDGDDFGLVVGSESGKAVVMALLGGK